MKPRAAVVVTTGFLIVAVFATVSITHHNIQQRLLGEWVEAQSIATASGLRLQGRPEAGLGFGLAIANPTLRALDDDLTVSADRLVLHRSSGGRVTVALPEPASITASNHLWRVWGRLRATFGNQLDVDGAMVRWAGGGGPDDIANIGHIEASVAREPQALRLVAQLLDVALPRNLTRVQRSIHRAAIDVEVHDRTLLLRSAGLDWEGTDADLQGTLVADRSGALSGRLSLNLGADWQDAITRTVADRLISPAQGQAAMGLLSLLMPNPSALPVAVESGRVTLAGLLIADLPRLPPLRR